MQDKIQLTLTPEQASIDETIKKAAALYLGVDESDFNFRISRKSIDARSKDIRINLWLDIFQPNVGPQTWKTQFHFLNVSNGREIHIVGAGPAGLFAALKCLEVGFKPVIFEQGKDVSERKKDIAQIYRKHEILADSNYCFGEGGAGTFSDGKLYTRSNKRGDIDRILQLLNYHGADDEILYEAHPHIGTDKLPEIIKKIRHTIIECGGEIYFSKKLTDIIIQDDEVKEIVVNNNERQKVDTLVLATGHSARDLYYMLQKKDIKLEAKQFAMGVRVEHPQKLVDDIQYHHSQNPYLPAASYSLTTQVENRGVYSFCMCPGGYIVPAATSANEIVVNGMSSSARHTPYANSGMVVEVHLDDLEKYSKHGELAGLAFQEDIERMAYINGGRGQIAPAQRLADFVRGRLSSALPENSYIPGLLSSPLHFWLPENIGSRLQQAFKNFEKKMRGYLTNEAIVVGVESRSSSPVRIPRNPETFQHVKVKGLYPCGEGAGYAGGIVSSAMDGENVISKIKELSH
ncbi:MAG TPA: FAD-binding protein [Bacteroidales bacterium]|nr:FAD-binding protein [Bacteroidales bacterium]